MEKEEAKNTEREQPFGRLLVVSNRLPVTLRRSGDQWRTERSAGGLATAMNPILKQSGGAWIGWPGEAVDERDEQAHTIFARWAKDHYTPVHLPAEVASQYYEGYANQTLWPLFHHFPSRLLYSPEGWDAYVEANRRFGDAVAAQYRPGDLIWVHDYHLMLLPELLRAALPGARIGFFLHIPFPSSEVFRILPRRDELLRGMLGADLLAFQTHQHLQHFRTSLLRILGIDSRIDGVDIGGRFARLEALPIGIAPEEFTSLLDTPETAAYMSELNHRFQGQRILLAVDRLDYTKGIPERLRTYRRLLEAAPRLRGTVVLIQVAVPSRERIASYDDLRRRVNELVGDINGHFGTPDWTPVVYIRRGIPRSHLVALYASADVGWITPLRDGMNLVAKEYVACKRGADGALVLSEFAGAAAEMGEAFAVNPYDEERTASVIERVLEMPPRERRERMAALHARVLRNNVFAWSDRFLKALSGESAPSVTLTARAEPLDLDAVVAAYRVARRRQLFLDYDGTLVPFAERPESAVPPPRVLRLLERLATTPGNSVVIISGRPRTDLDKWFGGIAGLSLAAEHGAVLKTAGSADWEPLNEHLDAGWKSLVRPILEHFVDRTPGSFVEDKAYSLVWHYRMADPEFGEWLANELVAMLDGMLAESDLRPVRGQKTVEVKPVSLNKGEAARVLSGRTSADFRFAAGDDRTDEDLFASLAPPAWTVHIGPGRTCARFSLPEVTSLVRLLERFTAAEGGAAATAHVPRIAAPSD
jgi:trehalose 6-phosphate synthase/phosphatase